jgi:hypothetical protein
LSCRGASVGADKSAVGTINRPLRLVGVLVKFESGWLIVSTGPGILHFVQNDMGWVDWVEWVG